MELKDLVGLRSLTAVDMSEVKITEGYNAGETANAIAFTLDGQTYRVAEDPEDGYRSSAREIQAIPDVLVNQFQPCAVLVRYVDGLRGYYAANDLLEMVDTVTGKVVLEVGTENTDDYYPCYVANFTPENMAANQPTEAA